MSLGPGSFLLRKGDLTRRTVFGIRRKYQILSLLNDFKRRDLLRNSHPANIINDCAEQVRSLPPVVYAGFDPTSDSLHIGNLLVLINLLRGGLLGVQPIALIGGATASIGDPSGRETEREQVQIEWVQTNCLSIKQQVQRIASNVMNNHPELEKPLIIVDNNDWFGKMPMIDYLRACKQLRVGEMLRMGAIKSRMSDNSGISHTEFCYQTMQAYDWKVLAEKYSCLFQIGGSDQLGHLDLGAHFVKRTTGIPFAAGVCLPLITDKAGNKLGKSVGGGIWLDANKTSPFHFYQFLRQLHDTEAEEMLLKFSLKSVDELEGILAEHRRSLGKWIAQDALASEMTRLVHGDHGLEVALQCSRAVFQGSMEDVIKLDRKMLIILFGTVIELSKRKVSTMGELADMTRSDNQRGSILMTKGAFKLNGQKVLAPNDAIDFNKIVLPNSENLSLILWGKRNFQLVSWIP